MIAILGKGGPPDEATARRALAAVPWPTPQIECRRLGDALLGVATRPDFTDESLSADGDLIAVLAGRLDNGGDLHRELSAAGTPPRSTADADVVVAAFRAHGRDAVQRFRGAFAGVVTDGTTLWAFRDQVGFRGLFYRNDDAGFLVAGEARQVVVAAGIAEEPHLEVAELLYYGGMPSNTPAALKGVQRLIQGAFAEVTRDRVYLERYWTPWLLFETARMGVDEAGERFLALLQQAVARSMTGNDVVFLSGGLDSPAIAAFAAPEHVRRTGRPVGALSAVFPDLPDVDERALTTLVAERFGMDLHTYRPGARALDDVEEWSRRFGTPVPTLSIPEVWEAYARARALGYRNVLTGEFAELTYGKFPHLLSHLLLKGRWRALLGMIASEHARGASRTGLVLDALTAFVPGKLANRFFWRQRTAQMAREIPTWVRTDRLKRPQPRPDLLPPPRERYRTLQLWGLEGCTVTMEADATCAAIAGVTIRRPFADVDLWEFFLSLPAEVKFPELRWKALARRALRGVIPDEILDKQKKTFFDPHVLQQVDYPLLERLLVPPRHRLPGVDYDDIARRLERRDLGMGDWLAIRELARVHAFLNAW